MIIQTLQAIFNSIIGTYTPITYVDYAADGTAIDVVPAGLAGVDFSYVLPALLFVVFCYGLLRIIGGLISRG